MTRLERYMHNAGSGAVGLIRTGGSDAGGGVIGDRWVGGSRIPTNKVQIYGPSTDTWRCGLLMSIPGA